MKNGSEAWEKGGKQTGTVSVPAKTNVPAGTPGHPGTNNCNNKGTVKGTPGVYKK